MNNTRHTALLAFLNNPNTSILFIRHGNTSKAENDAERRLTMKGRFQAERARDYINKQHSVTLVVTSNVSRALETISDSRWPTPVGISELYLTPRTNPELIAEADVLDAAFNKLGYSPLKSYVDEPGVTDALCTWCERALEAIDRTVSEMRPASGTIVVGGHAVMSNALCAYLALASNHRADMSVVMDTNLGECDHLQLVVRDGQALITHFPLQESPTDDHLRAVLTGGG